MINIGSIFEDTIYKETYKKDVVDSTDDDEHMIYVTVSPVPLFVKIVFFTQSTLPTL